jgi:hypothetical protein
MNRQWSILLVMLMFFAFSVSGYADVPSGNWYLVASSQVAADASQIPQLGGSLTQTGTSISGVLHVSNSPCFDWATDIPVSGMVNGNSVNFVSDDVVGQIITITGAVAANAVSGTYTISNGCADGDHGTINAVLVSPVTGSWTGALTSNSSNQAASISFAQDVPNPDGYSPLTGTLLLPGSTCFASGTLDPDQSWTLGNIVQAIVVMSDGSQVALSGFITDASTTGKQITVNFSVNGGGCSGQTGSATFVRNLA